MSVLSPGRFFLDLIGLLSNPQFQYIRQTYMKTWSDVETLMMYIFVSELITIEYQKRYQHTISPDRLANLLGAIFDHHEHRQKAVQLFRHYQKCDMSVEKFTDKEMPRLPSGLFLTDS